MTRNKILLLAVIVILGLTTLVGLSHAFMFMGVLKFGFMLLVFLGVGYCWGRFSKEPSKKEDKPNE